MYKVIGACLRSFLGRMYQIYGLNKITLFLSQLLDILVIREQKEKLNNVKTSNNN
ncbi:MAG: hypothetical protein RR942_15055 [Romboutsia sp.]